MLLFLHLLLIHWKFQCKAVFVWASSYVSKNCVRFQADDRLRGRDQMLLFLQSVISFFLKASVLEAVCALYRDCCWLCLAQRALYSQFFVWICRRWITWNPSSQSVIGEQNWPRNAWLRHRKRSVLKCLQRYFPCSECLSWMSVREHWSCVVCDTTGTQEMGSTKALWFPAILLKFCSGCSCGKLTGVEDCSSIKHEL